MWTTVLGLFSKMKPVLSNKYVLIGLSILVASVGGYLFGKFSAPAKVVEKEKVVEKVVYQEKVVEKVVYVEKKNEKKRKETTTVERPDGTKETKTVENEETNTDTNVNKDTTRETVIYKDKIVEKEKLVLRSPDWRVGVGVGVNALYYAGKEADYLTQQMKGVTLQLEVDRRIAGPVWMGLFVNTHSDVGLNLSFQF